MIHVVSVSSVNKNELRFYISINYKLGTLEYIKRLNLIRQYLANSEKLLYGRRMV